MKNTMATMIKNNIGTDTIPIRILIIIGIFLFEGISLGASVFLRVLLLTLIFFAFNLRSRLGDVVSPFSSHKIPYFLQ